MKLLIIKITCFETVPFDALRWYPLERYERYPLVRYGWYPLSDIITCLSNVSFIVEYIFSNSIVSFNPNSLSFTFFIQRCIGLFLPTSHSHISFVMPEKNCVGFMKSCSSTSLKLMFVALLFPFPLNFINGFDNSFEVNKCNSDSDLPISEIVLKSL